MLHSWALVEGTLADKYGLSLRDIVEMSWRRFVILYQYLFVSGALTHVSGDDDKPSPAAESLLKGGRSYDNIDWDELANKPPADHKRTLSFDEFAAGSGLTRKVID